MKLRNQRRSQNVDPRILLRLEQLEVSDIENREVYKRPLKVGRISHPTYWRNTMLIFSDIADISLYYSMLGKLASLYKTTRQFIEVLIVRAFETVSWLYEESSNTVLIDVDRILNIQYSNIRRLARRWAHRRKDFEEFWTARTLTNGSILDLY